MSAATLSNYNKCNSRQQVWIIKDSYGLRQAHLHVVQMFLCVTTKQRCLPLKKYLRSIATLPMSVLLVSWLEGKKLVVKEATWIPLCRPELVSEKELPSILKLLRWSRCEILRKVWQRSMETCFIEMTMVTTRSLVQESSCDAETAIFESLQG